MKLTVLGVISPSGPPSSPKARFRRARLVLGEMLGSVSAGQMIVSFKKAFPKDPAEKSSS